MVLFSSLVFLLLLVLCSLFRFSFVFGSLGFSFRGFFSVLPFSLFVFYGSFVFRFLVLFCSRFVLVFGSSVPISFWLFSVMSFSFPFSVPFGSFRFGVVRGFTIIYMVIIYDLRGVLDVISLVPPCLLSFCSLSLAGRCISFRFVGGARIVSLFSFRFFPASLVSF